MFDMGNMKFSNMKGNFHGVGDYDEYLRTMKGWYETFHPILSKGRV